MSKLKPLFLELEIGHSKAILLIGVGLGLILKPRDQKFLHKFSFPGRFRYIPVPMKNSIFHGSLVIYLAIE